MRKAVRVFAVGALLLAGRELRASVDLGNVVCLGDSLTEGKYVGGGGYRQFLQDDLTAQGYTYDFVGKEDNGQPQNYTGYSIGMADPNHEGYGSFTISNIVYGSNQEGHAAPAVGTLLNDDATVNPDGSSDPVSLVLLLIGTNNMGINGNSYDSNAPSELNGLVGDILNAVPGVGVIVGSLPPLASSVGLSRAQSYNATIPNMVATYQAAGENVRFADLYSSMNPGQLDPTDGIHPIASGYQNIAQVWAQAIGQTSMNVSNSSAVFAPDTAWTSGTLFVNNGGVATFQGDSGPTGTANLSITVPTGSVLFESTQHLAALTIGYQNSVQVTANNHQSILVTSALINNGTLDLSDNEMDVQNGSLSAVTGMIENGFAGDNGSIISSTAAGDITHLTTLGVILNNADGTPLYGSGTALGLFAGSNPSASDVLVKYTYYGDANLDGKVDGSDYALVDNGYLTQATGWYNGDFNYDGVVDGSDYTLIDNAFNMQGAQLNDSPANPSASITAEIAGSASSVPEPGVLTILTAGAVHVLHRRRRAMQ